MEFVIGIILVLTFFALAYYCVKGHNLMIGFLIISITWTALSLLGTVVASPEFIAENPILLVRPRPDGDRHRIHPDPQNR